MSTESENLPVKSEFQIMDEADAAQIAEADSAIKQALAYESNGKKQLSYMGIKWIVLKMSQSEQPLEIIGMPDIELIKHDLDDKNFWIWYAIVKVRNKKTGLETIGASESPFIDAYKVNIYDTFGRTKAISKAERNAYRKQIPELELNTMLQQIQPGDIQKLNSSTQNTTPAPVAPHYLETLKSLGYTGEPPKTSFEATKIISELKKNVDPAKILTTDDQKEKLKELDYNDKIPETKDEAAKLLDRLTDAIVHGKTEDDYEKYCTGKIGGVTHNFIPNSITSGKTCQTCNKLAPKEKAE